MLTEITNVAHPVSQREHPSLLCGVLTPLLTPERLDGRIDFEGLEALADLLCGKPGVSALLVRACESRMWSYTLEEARDAIGAVIDVARGRKPVIAGTAGGWSGDPADAPRPGVYLRQSVQLSEWALARGAAAVIQPVPSFLDGGIDYTPQDRVVRYFEDFAKAVKGPVILYNQPRLSKEHALTPPSVERLSRQRNLKGIVYATSDSSLLAELGRRCDPRFSVMSGFDSLAVPAFMAGATSSAGVLSTLVPEVLSAAWKSLGEPDLPFAFRAQTDLLRLREVLRPYQGADIGCALLARMGVAMAGRSRGAGRVPLAADLDRAHREISHIRAAYL